MKTVDTLNPDHLKIHSLKPNITAFQKCFDFVILEVNLTVWGLIIEIVFKCFLVYHR